MAVPDFQSTWIVVPYYHGEKYLRKILAPLQDMIASGLNIVFVDNSAENEAKIPSTLAEDLDIAFHVMRTQPRIGFGRACNLGAEYARRHGACRIILLNQDAVLTKNALHHLLETADAKTNSILAPLEVDPVTGQFHPQYAEWYLRGITATLPTTPCELPAHLIPRNTLCGMCLLIPMDAIENIGLFDPLFTMYGEDGDFCARASDAGVEMHIVPQAVVAHEHSNLRKTGPEHARIVVWTRESKLLKALRDKPSFAITVGKAIVQRFGERIYDGLKLRDFDRLRFSFESDQRLWRKRAMILSARKGESPAERGLRVALTDLRAAKIYQVNVDK